MYRWLESLIRGSSLAIKDVNGIQMSIAPFAMSIYFI